jgi:hypothetical protein
MKRKEAVKEFLRTLEVETGRPIRYAMHPSTSGVGHIQVIIYPINAEASYRTFNLHDGLTHALRREIRAWADSFETDPLPPSAISSNHGR